MKWNGSVECGYVKRSFYAGNRPMAEIGGSKLFSVFLRVLYDLHMIDPSSMSSGIQNVYYFLVYLKTMLDLFGDFSKQC